LPALNNLKIAQCHEQAAREAEAAKLSKAHKKQELKQHVRYQHHIY